MNYLIIQVEYMNSFKNKWSKFFFYPNAWWMLVLLFIALINSAIFGGLTPKLTTNLLKSFDNSAAFNLAMKKLAINFILIYVNRVVYQYVVNKYIRELIFHVRSQIYGWWIHCSDIAKNERYTLGEIISRVMNDSESLRDLITSGVVGILIDFTFIISGLITFITMSGKLGSIMSFFEILAVVALLWGSRFLRKIFNELRDSQASMNRTLANLMGGVTGLYFIKHNNYLSTKASSTFDKYLEKQHIANIWDAFYYALGESIYPLMLLILLYVFPFVSVLEGGIIFALVDLLQRSISPIKEISGKLANVQRAMSGIDRMMNFFTDLGGDEILLLQNSSYEKLVNFIELKVEIDHFSFNKQNNSNFILENIKIDGKKGEVIGIIGPSGSGKSTVLNLLSGNLSLTSSSAIHINFKEQTIRLDKPDLIKKYMSLVSQDAHLFSENILFNLTFQNELTSDVVAKWNFVKTQINYIEKKGWELTTKLTKSTVSAGEKQLISGLRAYFLKKEVILIDEISSSLDSELELALRMLIKLIHRDALTIIVAHRIETIIDADKLYVMENGRVISTGIHQALLKSCSVYQGFIKELSY